MPAARCCGPDPVLATVRDIADLVGNAAFADELSLVRDKADFAPGFWDLRSGLLGELAQKLANYHVTLTITGDFAPEIAASRAFRDFLRESNRNGPIFTQAG